ncbi:DUF2624 domain-containing protein [Rossellomorea vietnamensis]|uniref:DUF2624 domain-containing protein n=2 Tax=Rossellomorea TaxID=2837508 RepID=A0A5D4KDV9_9BACI|nr:MULTISPECIES: DUF2624 domain-containing protein [Rossellomorea]TYR75498.1 DUF2624 domain-containing protein [Rossellomorea vietnamensis]TYS76543.1 DUF2624 domain-containing protein [Rossellomorea aquimaris]
MKLLQNVINHKINSITGDDLLSYGKQFNVNISPVQAEKIAAYLRGKNINIFDNAERSKVIKEIAKIAGPSTAKDVNKIFTKFVN